MLNIWLFSFNRVGLVLSILAAPGGWVWLSCPEFLQLTHKKAVNTAAVERDKDENFIFGKSFKGVNIKPKVIYFISFLLIGSKKRKSPAILRGFLYINYDLITQ